MCHDPLPPTRATIIVGAEWGKMCTPQSATSLLLLLLQEGFKCEKYSVFTLSYENNDYHPGKRLESLAVKYSAYLSVMKVMQIFAQCTKVLDR